MKAKAVKPYTDRLTMKQVKPGQTVEVTPERLRELEGYVVAVKEKKDDA